MQFFTILSLSRKSIINIFEISSNNPDILLFIIFYSLPAISSTSAENSVITSVLVFLSITLSCRAIALVTLRPTSGFLLPNRINFSLFITRHSQSVWAITVADLLSLSIKANSPTYMPP